ncbi:hypothetical protein K402DRAFT_325300, partial [Aulographum hederae CBS 113979]
NSPGSKRQLKPTPISASPSQLPMSAETSAMPQMSHQAEGGFSGFAQPPPPSPSNPRKRTASQSQQIAPSPIAPSPSTSAPGFSESSAMMAGSGEESSAQPPPPKKGRTNTPWTPGEEQRLKTMRDAGHSWSEIAKTFPARTEGSVKKHWYKDMHYAEFAEDESAALLQAIKEYEANKWKAIGQKVGKPAKACEQYAKEHFGGKY